MRTKWNKILLGKILLLLLVLLLGGLTALGCIRGLQAIGWSGGVMNYLNIDYTPMTATLGALILGVGSEYAILMMERYFEEKDKGKSPIEAIRTASSKIGSAILASGATTVFGFMALLVSPFPMISDFGMVTVIDMDMDTGTHRGLGELPT